MRKIKKIVSLVLACSLVFGLVGCGKKKEVKKTDGKTFRIATVRHSDRNNTDFLEEGMLKKLEEKYGINIEWEVYTANDWGEQKTLLFASPEDLPDAFLGGLTLKDADIQVYKSEFVELSDYIEKDMPNLSKIMKEDSQFKANMYDADGEIYSLGKKLPLRPLVHNEPFINKKWLKNLGLKVPKTYKELEKVLQEFKDKDADGNGDPNNEIPYTASGNLGLDTRTILAPFGIVTSNAGNYMGMDENNKPFFIPTSDRYKEAVKWMHDLYKKGIIDSEYFTQDSSMEISKIQASGGSEVGLVFGWTKGSAAGANAKEFEKMEAVEGPDGNHYVEYDPSSLDEGGVEFVVTKRCQNVDLLLKWADEFYSNEIAIQSYWGSIPDRLSDNGDGTYTVLKPDKDETYDAAAWNSSFRDFGPKYVTKDFEKNIILPKDGGDGQKLAEDINAKYSKVTFPVLRYTRDEYTKLGQYSTDVNTYVEAQYAHWVVDGGIEKEWDNYISVLKQMGLEDLLKLYDTAYNRYLKMQK
ncbi:hypothetical protein [Eubacterium sp.]